MNPRSRANAASGSSRQAPWPEAAKLASRPQGAGIAAAMSRESASGQTGSSAPATTSTGQRTWANPGSRFMPCCSPPADEVAAFEALALQSPGKLAGWKFDREEANLRR